MAKNSNGDRAPAAPKGWRKVERKQEIWWKPLVNHPIVVDVLQRAQKDDDMRDDGIQVFYQCRLVQSAQHATKEGRETLDRGTLINISESYQLAELQNGVSGGRCWINYTGDEKIKGGKTVKKFEIHWDDSCKPKSPDLDSAQQTRSDDIPF